MYEIEVELISEGVFGSRFQRAIDFQNERPRESFTDHLRPPRFIDEELDQVDCLNMVVLVSIKK